MSIRPVILAVLVLLTARSGAGSGWTSLFNGKNLDGWVQLNGTALYVVENGDVVGRCVEGSPNSFLCTTQQFGDFIFECETRVDWTLNSGVKQRRKAGTDE